MPASVRFELFPAELDKSIKFYTEVLRFTLLRRDADGKYAYLQRDAIFIGLGLNVLADFPNGTNAEVQYRPPPTGVEIVFEVDDLDEERDLILGKGWKLDSDLKMQFWGLRDFRIKDPNGYYIRITTKGKGGRAGHED